MKMFVEQGFLHDLFLIDWSRIALIDDVEIALSFFQNGFLDILNRHAPIHKSRIKGRANPWFTVLHKRNVAWAKAKRSDAKNDWLLFRETDLPLFLEKRKLNFIYLKPLRM